MRTSWQTFTAKVWGAFAPGGMGSHTREQSHIFTINLFSLLAFLTLGLFGILEIVVEGEILLGLLELFGSLTIALNAIGLRFSQNATLARNLLLLVILVYLMLMLMTGGTKGTGIFWYFIFPVSAFYLAGKQQGLYWMGALIGGTVFLRILDSIGYVQLPYEPVVIRQLIFSVIIVSIGILFYELSREGAERRMRKEQAELDQAKNEFLALASHQLRTPISAISWFSEMMLHGDTGTLKSAQKEHVKQIYESNQRSAAIVDAMITVSNLQVGPLAMHLEEVDVGALCRKVVKTQKETIQGVKQIEVTEQYGLMPTLTCDPSLMRTIIQNLVSNAFKYTPDGGHVTITSTLVDKKLISLSEGSVRITIEDTGYGIPKNQQGKIFAKLFRASNIKTKDTDGTGLGLYIVKTILEQVGGQIEFASEENKGSIFTVTLPLEGMSRVHQSGGNYV